MTPPAPPPRHRSFPPVVDEATRVLILGSLPGAASLAAGRYYAHPQNQFWRLTGAVIDRDLHAMNYDARLAALRAAGIGLWDMVAEATRAGSLDSAIRDVETNDLRGLLRRLPGLRAIACNGKTAGDLALRNLRGAGSPPPLVQLPSSSPAFTLAIARKAEDWRRLRAWLAGPA